MKTVEVSFSSPARIGLDDPIRGFQTVNGGAGDAARVARTLADTDNTWSGANWQEFGPGEDCTDGTSTTPPTATDRAIIVSGKTCNVDVTTAVADSVNVESTATLNIQAGKKLTIDDDAGSDTTIAGTLNLQGASSELAFEDNDQTIDGAGKIVGQDNAATITVSFGETLTNETTIEGKLKITDDTTDGTFLNHGLVWANSVGLLEISTNTMGDNGAGDWKVSGGVSATLLFNPASTTFQQLFAPFTLMDNGTLEVASGGFSTKGSLYWDGGTITLAPNVSVEFGFNS